MNTKKIAQEIEDYVRKIHTKERPEKGSLVDYFQAIIEASLIEDDKPGEGYVFYQVDDGIGIVDKEFWEENGYLDDCGNEAEINSVLSKLKFTESCECVYEYHGKGDFSEVLINAGFEPANPFYSKIG